MLPSIELGDIVTTGDGHTLLLIADTNGDVPGYYLIDITRYETFDWATEIYMLINTLNAYNGGIKSIG